MGPPSDRVSDVLAILDALAAKGVTGPVSVWGVQCVLPAPEMKAEAVPGPASVNDMLNYFAGATASG